eukprot:SAG11_NODE_25821_length_353_cov_1.216535_1_plen_27_part_10
MRVKGHVALSEVMLWKYVTCHAFVQCT